MDLLTYRPINPRLKPAKSIALHFVIAVTILALSHTALAQEERTKPIGRITGTVPGSEPLKDGEEKEKVAPERLLFISYGAFGKRFQNPMGVFYDSQNDEILVADAGNNRIVVLDGTDGYPKAAFTHWVWRSGESEASLGGPRSIAVNSLGDIFIADSLCNYVAVCDFRGSRLMEIRIEDYMLQRVEASAQSMAAGMKPVAVAVDSEDNLYVATPRWIFIFDRELKFHKQFSRKGQEPVEFTGLLSFCVDTAGSVFVTSAQGMCIRVLSSDGEELLAFGGHGAGFSNFSLPIGIMTDRRGYIWVVDSLRHIVPIFDANGKFLDYIGAFGAGPGYFAFPNAIAASDDGKIVVLERVNARLQCFELAQPSGEEVAASVEETTSGEIVEE